MISSQATDSMERIFRRAVQARLPLGADDNCEVTREDNVHAAPSRSQGNVVMLTISSIAFRMILVLHFEDDASTRAYCVSRHAEASVRDTLLEAWNLCCGAVNQELLEFFPDLGMSTPYVLGAHCVRYLDELKPDYLASFAIDINGCARFAATLGVCADATIDFIASETAIAETSGELELF
jgi:hypothetical protein